MLGDPRQEGRRLILQAIRGEGRVARVDLAKETGISAATVTAITADLLGEGLIEEVPGDRSESGSRRGRPRIDLKVNGDAHIVAGVKITEGAVKAIFVDFEGTPIGSFARKLDGAVFPPRELCRAVGEFLRDAAGDLGFTIDDISAVGLGLAGIVDVTRGFVHWSPWLSVRNVALRDLLRVAIGCPVFIENDANLVAKAEQFYGYGQGIKDFLVVTIEAGVGMGIVLNGELFRGTRGCGAEFGHTKVQLDGALCRCGQRGCVEAYIGDHALMREAVVSGLTKPNLPPEQQLQALMEAAAEGEAKALSILDQAAQIFAMGLANLVNIFDPQLIILSGEQMKFDFLYAEDVIARIRTQIVQIDAKPPEILIHKWGDLLWAKGAAAFALDCVAEQALLEMSA